MKMLWRVAAALVFSLAVQAETSTSSDASFEGRWSGQVQAPNATAELGLLFSRGPHGLSTQFSMPVMFVSELDLGPAEIAGETYTQPALGIQLVRRGDVLEGTFANPLLHVELHRAAALPQISPAPSAPGGPEPVWSRDLGAKIWASPVARAGLIFVGSIDGQFHAVRATDGDEAWTWSGPHPLFGEALATDDSVYFLDDAGDCVSLDRATGALRWRRVLGRANPEVKDPTFNHRTATPVIADNEIYVGSTSGQLYALDPETGKIRWEHALGAAIYSAVAVDGNQLFATGFDGTVLMLNRRTHEEIRRVKLGGSIASAPVVAGDFVLVGGRDYLLYGLRRADLSVAWRDSFWFSWVESAPRVESGIAYIGGSDYRRISAIEPATGVATWATDVGGLTWGTPVVTDTTVFAGTSAQNPAAIKHQGGITALDRRTGAVKWQRIVPLPAKADRAGYLGSLVLVDGKLIGAGYDGTLVGLPIDSSPASAGSDRPSSR